LTLIPISFFTLATVSNSRPAPFRFRTEGKFCAQSSRLAEFGGLGISFNICRGTLRSLAMFIATSLHRTLA
jgi:hypothetical protein